MRFRRDRLAITSVFAGHGAVTGSFAARLPAMSDHLHLTPGALGFALLMPAVGGLVTMPFAGRLIHRLGVRSATRVLIVAWGAALALPALAGGLWSLAAVLIAYGAAAGMSDIAMNAQGVAIEGRLGRSIMSGLHGMWSVGGFVGSGIGAVMAAFGVDYRVHLALLAVAIAALMSLVGSALPAAADDISTAPAPPRFSLPTGTTLLLGLVGFCAIFAEATGTDWSAVYLNRVTGAGQAVAAAAYTVFACVMAGLRLGGDALVHRIGPVRTVRIGGVVSAVGGALIVLARVPALAFAGFALLGAGIAVVVPLAFASAGRTGPHPGQAIAGVATVSYGAGLIAPAVIGGIATVTALPVAFVLVAVLPLFIAIGASLMRGPAVDPPGTPASGRVG